MNFILSIIEGAQPYSNGHELQHPDSPIGPSDLPDDVWEWLDANGCNIDNPDVWVLVTPADEDPNAGDVVASRTLEKA